MILSPEVLIREMERARKKLRVGMAFENAYITERGVSMIPGMINPMAMGVKVLIPIDGNPNQIISLGEA